MWNLVGEPIKELESNPNPQEGEKKTSVHWMKLDLQIYETVYDTLETQAKVFVQTH